MTITDITTPQAFCRALKAICTQRGWNFIRWLFGTRSTDVGFCLIKNGLSYVKLSPLRTSQSADTIQNWPFFIENSAFCRIWALYGRKNDDTVILEQFCTKPSKSHRTKLVFCNCALMVEYAFWPIFLRTTLLMLQTNYLQFTRRTHYWCYRPTI